MRGLANWSLSLAGLGSLCWLGALLRALPEDMRGRLGLLGGPFLAAGVALGVLAAAVAMIGRALRMRWRGKADAGPSKGKLR